MSKRKEFELKYKGSKTFGKGKDPAEEWKENIPRNGKLWNPSSMVGQTLTVPSSTVYQYVEAR